MAQEFLCRANVVNSSIWDSDTCELHRALKDLDTVSVSLSNGQGTVNLQRT